MSGPVCIVDDMEMEPGGMEGLSIQQTNTVVVTQTQIYQQPTASSTPRVFPPYVSIPPCLFHFLLDAQFNALLAGYLPTRDLFFLQFLNRNIFTLLNSNALLLQVYYRTAQLSSFIPFMVDDFFVQSFLSPTYIDLPDGSKAVRNTYSMHIQHLYLNFCTRISNHSMHSIATHIGANLLTLNLEGVGRSRVTESGVKILFTACKNLTDLNLNGFYQLNMETTCRMLVENCAGITQLSMNGCSQMNENSIAILGKLRLRALDVSLSNITDVGLQHIATAYKDQLKILHVGYCGSITDRGIAALVNYCRNLEDLNLYGCYGLSRHALSYLRLCPLLQRVDISRIHALDDTSIAEWILPTAQLQQQQLLILKLVAEANPSSNVSAITAQASNHHDFNPNLPQIFVAQQLNPNIIEQQNSVTKLKQISLDSCTRISSLGLKVLLEHCPSMTYVNAFGCQNLSILGLQSLLQIVISKQSPLKQLEIGGCMSLNPREVEALRQQFAHLCQIKF